MVRGVPYRSYSSWGPLDLEEALFPGKQGAQFDSPAGEAKKRYFAALMTDPRNFYSFGHLIIAI